jgi:hypothetical protein
MNTSSRERCMWSRSAARTGSSFRRRRSFVSSWGRAARRSPRSCARPGSMPPRTGRSYQPAPTGGVAFCWTATETSAWCAGAVELVVTLISNGTRLEVDQALAQGPQAKKGRARETEACRRRSTARQQPTAERITLSPRVLGSRSRPTHNGLPERRFHPSPADAASRRRR